MMGRKLAIACLAALTAMAMYGCTSDNKDPTDAGTQPLPCDGKCATDGTEKCDTTLETPACVNVCTGTKSKCPKNLVCDVAQKACVAPKCSSGEQCEKGQNCWDVMSTVDGSGPTAGDSCTCAPALTTGQPDSCEAFGMICSMIDDVENIKASKCRMPKEFEHCTKSVGCADNLDCAPSFLARDEGTTANICVRKCAKTTDCTDPMMKCWPNNSAYPPGLKLHCFYNYCATTQSGATDATKLFGECPSAAATDGQCMVMNDSDTGDAFGICQQTGTAPSLGECDPNATRATPEKLCAKGEYCEGVMPGATPGSVRGLCRKLCNAAPAGASRVPALDCAQDKLCADESGVSSNATGGKDARQGLCRDSCELLGTANSCTNDALGNVEDCYFNFGTGGETGVCRASTGNAAAPSGGDCAGPSRNDPRFDCKGRLNCLAGPPEEGYDNKCHKFCDLTVCPPDSQTDCAQCEAGQKCNKTMGPNQNPETNKVGWCL